MRRPVTIREHEVLRAGPGLTDRDLHDLGKLTGKVFKRKNGGLAANNHVGVVTTPRGLVLQILPKIDFGGTTDSDHEKCKKVFLQMLRCWRGLSEALSESGIRAMSRFPMLDVFVRQFLVNVNGLARAGLARRYIPVEENLPYLRGRLHFQGQLRENIANESRFFVTHEVLSVNRPVNRLIRSTLSRLVHVTRSEENLLLLRQLMAKFEEVPQSTNLHSDWEKHHVDRSMQLYAPVMQWVGLFLFNKGLTTFSGHHSNISLLFPMEKVFENFVTHSFSRHQKQYSVAAQHPRKYLATIEGREAFMTMPDIVLREGDRVKFILDAKWKDIDESNDDPKHGIDQADMYQLYAYGKRYGCQGVALVYPKTARFTRELRYQFFDDLPLFCLPFDVSNPNESVRLGMQVLARAQLSRNP